MSTATGLSIWLMPASPLRERLHEQIQQLSEQWNGPAFLPHITLLPGIPDQREQVVAQVQQAAETLHPFTLTLDKAESGTRYFYGVYLKAIPSLDVMMAHQEVARITGIKPAEPFKPHLSLLYGDQSAAERQTVLEALPQHDPPLSFQADKLYLVSTEGPPANWKEVGCFPLNRNFF